MNKKLFVIWRFLISIKMLHLVNTLYSNLYIIYRHSAFHRRSITQHLFSIFCIAQPSHSAHVSRAPCTTNTRACRAVFSVLSLTTNLLDISDRTAHSVPTIATAELDEQIGCCCCLELALTCLD